MASTDINGNIIDTSSQGRQSSDASGTNYILIEVDRDISDVEKQELQNLGIEIQQNLFQDTYLCKYEPEDLEVLRRLSFVKYADVYHQTLKIQASLKSSDTESTVATESSAAAFAATSKPAQQTSVIISLHKDSAQTSQQVAESLIAQGVIDKEKTKVYSERIDTNVEKHKLETVASLDSVKKIEAQPVISLFINQARIVTASCVYSNTSPAIPYTGKGQIVNIADTGFDKGSKTDVHDAYDDSRIKAFHNPHNPTSTTPSDFQDTNSHGTHVCGCALANGTTFKSRGGPADLAGKLQAPAPEADFTVTRMTNATGGFYSGPLSPLLDKLVTDASLKVRISNHSYGIRIKDTNWIQADYHAVNDDIDNYVFNHDDLLLIWAAGNDGDPQPPPGTPVPPAQIHYYPASKNVLTVANSLSSRRRNGPAFDPAQSSEADTFLFRETSSRGPVVGGRTKPDIAAPGTTILSTLSRMAKADPTYGVSEDPGYCFMTGTSQAAPHVAGCAAVLRQVLKQNAVPEPSAALMKALLINGAVNLSPANPVQNRNLEGFGRVSLRSTILSISPGASGGFRDVRAKDADALREKTKSKPITVTVPPLLEIVPGGDTYGRTLKVTLTWTDRFGKSLVNQLGLAVISNNLRRNGNKGDADMTATPSDYDTLNNVQQVTWKNCPPGDALIVVECTKAFAIAEQVGYALAWSLD